MKVFPKLVESMPLPIGNPAIFPTYLLSKIASKEVPVVFTGGEQMNYFLIPNLQSIFTIKSFTFFAIYFKIIIGSLVNLSQYKSTYSKVRLFRKLLSMSNQDLANAHYYCRCLDSTL